MTADVSFNLFVSDCELQEFYRYANEKFFNNNLPTVVVGITHDPADKNDYGCTVKMKGARYVSHIFLNPICQEWKKTGRTTLLHEMCHVKLNNTGGHGPRFQKEIRRLRDMGAFDPYL